MPDGVGKGGGTGVLVDVGTISSSRSAINKSAVTEADVGDGGGLVAVIVAVSVGAGVSVFVGVGVVVTVGGCASKRVAVDEAALAAACELSATIKGLLSVAVGALSCSVVVDGLSAKINATAKSMLTRETVRYPIPRGMLL